MEKGRKPCHLSQARMEENYMAEKKPHDRMGSFKKERSPKCQGKYAQKREKESENYCFLTNLEKQADLKSYMAESL